jgi:hypothetical protein
VTEQGSGKCSKGIIATNAGVDGLLTKFRIFFVVNLDFSSLLILLELFVVTPIVLPHANCCGGGTVPQT